MKKMMTAAMSLLAASVLCAQDFGAEVETEEVVVAEADEVEASEEAEVVADAAVERVLDAQESDLEESAEAVSAEEMLQDYCAQKGISTTWNEETKSLSVIEFVEWTIDEADVGPTFLRQRALKGKEVLLAAKAKIIGTIMSEMSAETMSDMPGNPIEKQLQEKQEQIEKGLRTAYKDLEALDAEFKDASKKVDTLTEMERLQYWASWCNKPETVKLLSEMDENKKKRYDRAKKAYEEAKKAFDEKVEETKKLQGQLAGRFKTSTERLSAMPLLGSTVLQQAESAIEQDDGTWKCQIAVLMTWSVEMQDAATAILKGEDVKFKPGKRSLNDWLKRKHESGALATWIGPRNFIDDKGNMHFIGIAARPVPKNSRKAQQDRKATGEEARADVVYSLFADVKMKIVTETETLSTHNDDGSVTEESLENLSEKMSQSFKKITISGLSEVLSRELTHELSSSPIRVIVCDINTGSASALKGIQAGLVAAGIDVNTAQEKERGRQAQLKADYEASKNNAAARAEGARQAKADINQAKKTNEARANKIKKSNVKKTSKVSKREPGRPKSGLLFIEDDE